MDSGESLIFLRAGSHHVFRCLPRAVPGNNAIGECCSQHDQLPTEVALPASQIVLGAEKNHLRQQSARLTSR